MPALDYSPEFDWSILSVPESMAMVRGQLGFSWLMLAERLGEIDDEAYLWEPAPGGLVAAAARASAHREEGGPGGLGARMAARG